MVSTIARPIQHVNMFFLVILFDLLLGVTWGPILHENGGAVDGEAVIQRVVKYSNISVCIRVSVPGEKEQTTPAQLCTETRPRRV